MDHDSLWKAAHASICSITHLAGSQAVGYGTGFRIGSALVTNSHVCVAPGNATHVRVRFVGIDAVTPSIDNTLSQSDFQRLLRDGEPASSWDFAVLDAGPFAATPPLVLGDASAASIGASIAFLGFHFDDSNLSIGAGYLSSRFQRAGVRYLQLDASVNQGNSGGPLLDPRTGAVIGIITRKATGLTQNFDQLIDSFDNNVRVLSQTGGAMMSIGGVDPVKALRITQEQMKRIAFEMRRSANVGIGYAYDVAAIASSLKKLGAV